MAVPDKDYMRANTSDIFPADGQYTASGQWKRLRYLEHLLDQDLSALGVLPPGHQWAQLPGHVENFVGYCQLPMGVAGPLVLRHAEEQRRLYVPLATTEGALIASYQRGMRMTAASGGIRAQSIRQSVSRCPLFRFSSLDEAITFMRWALEQEDQCHLLVRSRSRYAQLESIHPVLEGNEIWLCFRYRTADAAGQNMVTLCTEAIASWLARESPAPVASWYLDGNLSGDKKATQQALLDVRGHRTVAECRISAEALQEWVQSSAEAMERCWRGGVLGAIQSGATGALAHAANGLAALFLATGQDVACVAEAANGILRMEAHSDGSLYASVTLPNLIVGTVGGGTGFPGPQMALRMLGCLGPGQAPLLAEIAAATVLAGELSLTAAMAGGQFGRAHALLGRKRTRVLPEKPASS